jgi:hypothetical protein
MFEIIMGNVGYFTALPFPKSLHFSYPLTIARNLDFTAMTGQAEQHGFIAFPGNRDWVPYCGEALLIAGSAIFHSR